MVKIISGKMSLNMSKDPLSCVANKKEKKTHIVGKLMQPQKRDRNSKLH